MSGVCASRALRSFIDEFARSSLKRSCYKTRQAVVPPDESDSREATANAAPKHCSEIRSLTNSLATEPVKILLADDHPVVRRGVRALLESGRGFRVVGEAKSNVNVCKRARVLTS